MNNFSYKNFCIPSGLSLSSEINIYQHNLHSLIMPSAWTTASITFSCSIDSFTWVDLYDSAGNEYTVSTGTNRIILLDTSVFTLPMIIKVRSGTSGTPVAQGEDRIIKACVYEK